MEEPSLIVATSTAEDCNDASATVDAVDLAEAVDVEPGQVRFQGNFQGVATTHTHQIDLSMGFDVEVPSSMAADAMKQIESRGRSFSPHDRFPALRDRAETAPEPASIWRSLGSFFRRDARDSQRNEEQRRRSLSRGSAGYKLKIADQEARTQALTEELDASSGQVAQFEARINELEEEKYLLADQLEALRQEYAEQLLQSPNEDMGTAANEALAAAQHHVVMLTSQLAEAELAQTQVEASRQTLEQENKGLAQQVEELERRLHHELMDKANTTGSLRGDLAASEARTAQAEASAEAAHSAARELQEQKRSLEIEFERLQTHAAGINAKAELLERAQEANSVMNQDLSSQAEAHMGSMGADDALKIQTQLAYLEQANAELELQLTRSLELQNQESTRACDLDRLVNALKAEIGAAERAANFNKDASEEMLRKAEQELEKARSKAMKITDERDQAKRELVKVGMSEAAAREKAQAAQTELQETFAKQAGASASVSSEAARLRAKCDQLQRMLSDATQAHAAGTTPDSVIFRSATGPRSFTFPVAKPFTSISTAPSPIRFVAPGVPLASPAPLQSSLVVVPTPIRTNTSVLHPVGSAISAPQMASTPMQGRVTVTIHAARRINRPYT